MTEKQGKIVEAALQLFAREGYASTSTSRVAKLAGVSEALIFRHFGTKDGLLKAVIKMGEERARALYADIVMETDPKVILRKTLEIPVQIKEDPRAVEFWKLQYKIKWEMEEYGADKMEPLELALTNAFTKLGYENPGQETQHILIIIDGLAMRFYLQNDFELELQLSLIKKKYGL